MQKLFTFLSFFIFFTISAQEVTIVESASDYDVEEGYPEVARQESERILFFNSDITIAENADVTVKETIKVYANGQAIKRGLFRALPMVRNTKSGQEKIEYKIISITKDGRREDYHTETMNGVFNIYIGNKDIILQPGNYTFEIVYTTQDQIGHFDGYDEFYWNVNGTDWEFPIENIQATLTLPPGADILQNSCYTGVDGSQDQNCTAENLSPTKIIFKAQDLKSQENLTIAVGFKAGILKEPSPFVKWMKRNWPSLFLILAAFYLLYFFYDQWKKYGKDPEKPVVIPQFNAPGNLSPGSLGYIDKGKFDLTQVTANLVDLSIKGFVDIDEVKDGQQEFSFSKVFNLTKTGKEDNILQEDQKLLLKNIFGRGKKAIISGTYNSQIRNAVNNFERFIFKTNKLYLENADNQKLVYKALKIILIIFFTALLLSSLVTFNFKS